MSPVPFEKTELNPRATAELRLKSFSITLKRESHAIKLFQKELVFGQFQNKWSKCSGSSSQKLHLLESFIPILFKKVLVAILLCMSLKWKVMSFVHFVHLKGQVKTRRQ